MAGFNGCKVNFRIIQRRQLGFGPAHILNILQVGLIRKSLKPVHRISRFQLLVNDHLRTDVRDQLRKVYGKHISHHGHNLDIAFHGIVQYQVAAIKLINATTERGIALRNGEH